MYFHLPCHFSTVKVVSDLFFTIFLEDKANIIIYVALIYSDFIDICIILPPRTISTLTNLPCDAQLTHDLYLLSSPESHHCWHNLHLQA